jgi:hypothetical protein
MAEIHVSAGDNICDFCSQPHPTRTFDCPDFPMDGPHPQAGLPEYRSRGAWMACSTCGTLIDAGKWEELTGRATERLASKYRQLPLRILREQVRRSHQMFRQHYKAAQP